MAVEIDLLYSRLNEAKNRRNQWEPFFRNVRDLIRHKPVGIDPTVLGRRFTDKSYDPTAAIAHDILTRTFSETLVPRTSLWFGYKIPDSNELAPLNDDPDTYAWFEEISEITFHELHNSNFYPAIDEYIADFTSYNTSNIFSEEKEIQVEGFNGFNFKTLNVGEYVFEENQHGLVDAIFREYEMTARQIISRFQENRVPSEVFEQAAKKPDYYYDIKRFVFPRDDFPTMAVDARDLPIADIIIIDQYKQVLHEGGFDEFPHVVARFGKASGEQYGRGPSNIAMPAIKVLNKLREMELQGLAKAVNPVTMTTQQNLLSNLQLTSGGLTYVKDIEKIKTFPFEGRFDLSSLKADEIKQDIRDIFFADQLVLPRTKNMTATEVAELRAQYLRIIGPTTGQLIEGIKRLMIRVFSIGWRGGLYPDPPRSLIGLDELDVDFVGQLAKVQKQAQIDAMLRLTGIVKEFMEINPNAKNVINTEEGIRFAGPLMDVPSEFLRSEDETKEITDAENQARADRQRKAEQIALAEAAGKAAPALEQAGQIAGLIEQ